MIKCIKEKSVESPCEKVEEPESGDEITKGEKEVPSPGSKFNLNIKLDQCIRNGKYYKRTLFTIINKSINHSRQQFYFTTIHQTRFPK